MRVGCPEHPRCGHRPGMGDHWDGDWPLVRFRVRALPTMRRSQTCAYSGAKANKRRSRCREAGGRRQQLARVRRERYLLQNHQRMAAAKVVGTGRALRQWRWSEARSPQKARQILRLFVKFSLSFQEVMALQFLALYKTIHRCPVNVPLIIKARRRSRPGTLNVTFSFAVAARQRSRNNPCGKFSQSSARES